MLRVRLIIWYSILVVLTITTIGLIQYIRIRSSLFQALDASLIEDARTTLTLISTLPPGSNPQEMALHGEVHTSNSLRELIDHALSEVPDSLKGPELADRVVSEIIDQVLTELSFQDSSGKMADPLDAIVERTVSSRRNNFVEIYAFIRDTAGHAPSNSKVVHEQEFFRTANLGPDTLMRRVRLARLHPSTDTTSAYSTIQLHNERIRVARAHNDRFDVYVGYPVIDIDQNLARIRDSFFVGIPLALAISILGGLWLARKALRPIEQIAGMARDISAKNLSRRIKIPGKTDRELVTLTETLNLMFARLENSFQQVTQFTSDASHELKTPLAIMKGEIEQTSRHLEAASALAPEESREVLTSLMEEVERMERIVEGLLLLSRADDRQLPLDRQEIVLYDYLGSLGEDATILAEERGLTLQCTFDPRAKTKRVFVDPTRLYQVIMNLLDNALKYTPSGGTVTLFLNASDHTLRFGVADTGIGISSEEQLKIFRRFYRTDEARTGPHEDADRSLGLGLAIVKSIVEAHDGSIAVQSEKGKGTRFTITMSEIV
jgi:signal transduction histidine kinase